MKNILIVESDLAFALASMRAFMAAGFHAENATSASKALVILNESRIDGMILGLRPGDSRALQLLREIRSNSRTREIPIVAFARENTGDLMNTALFEGATECLTIGRGGAEELVSAIRRLVSPPMESEEEPAQEATPAATVLPTLEHSPKPMLPASETSQPSGDADRAPSTEPAIQSPDPIQRLKTLSRSLIGTQAAAFPQSLLLELHDGVQTFALDPEIQQSKFAVSLVEVLAALLKQLGDNPRSANSSNIRTISQAIDCLETLVRYPWLSSVPAEPHFRILSVDDDPSIRSIIQRSLALAGLTADTAQHPFEALEIAGRQRYHLFILDINMPGLTGFELCKKLRASAAYRETPVIFVTGSDNFESRIRSAGSGGSDFIGKPFLPKELAVKALIHLLPRHLGLGPG